MPIINQIVSGGAAPAGTVQITNNGIHDVTNYATANVQVPTTAPTLYREFQLDNNGVLQPNTTTTHVMDFTGVKNVPDYALYRAYYKNTAISGLVDMSDLTTVSGISGMTEMFYYCSGITSVDLSSLTTVSGNSSCNNMFYYCSGITNIDVSSLTTVSNNSGCNGMFRGCSGLTSVDLSSLTTVSNNSGCNGMFRGCSGLTSVDLSSLTTVSNSSGCQSMFRDCTGITNIELPSLTTISGSSACNEMFYGCTNLTRVSFYALTPSSFGSRTNQFNNMLSGVTGCSVHFPIAIQSTIGSWTDVTSGFGGTNTTVLFDIVTSLTGADSNTYTRKQKESTSTATAWIYNNALYYTSGTTEPTVGAIIYSDSACTTAVTTVSAIA